MVLEKHLASRLTYRLYTERTYMQVYIVQCICIYRSIGAEQ